jgi:hypothetical protein
MLPEGKIEGNVGVQTIIKSGNLHVINAAALCIRLLADQIIWITTLYAIARCNVAEAIFQLAQKKKNLKNLQT